MPSRESARSTTPTRAPSGYRALLQGLKQRIRLAQVQAALAANLELLRLYWHVGRDLDLRTSRGAWGTGIIDRLSRDLQSAFPGMEGLSPRNLRRMRAFYRAYSVSASSPTVHPLTVVEADGTIWPQAVAKLPWGHNIILLERCKDPATRAWYAQAAVEHGWSRDILAHQIESQLHRRQGGALTNFVAALPSPQSDLAQQTLKDPYVFDFLDLLFYHTKMHCYVVLELKAGAFKPEYAGKMNFYLSAVDTQLRNPEDNPTIGLILCKERNRIIVEYALRDTAKPIGVAAYRLTARLPARYKGSLPTVRQLEDELG